jgi:hypothetical protein
MYQQTELFSFVGMQMNTCPLTAHKYPETGSKNLYAEAGGLNATVR